MNPSSPHPTPGFIDTLLDTLLSWHRSNHSPPGLSSPIEGNPVSSECYRVMKHGYSYSLLHYSAFTEVFQGTYIRKIMGLMGTVRLMGCVGGGESQWQWCSAAAAPFPTHPLLPHLPACLPSAPPHLQPWLMPWLGRLPTQAKSCGGGILLVCPLPTLPDHCPAYPVAAAAPAPPCVTQVAASFPPRAPTYV